MSGSLPGPRTAAGFTLATRRDLAAFNRAGGSAAIDLGCIRFKQTKSIPLTLTLSRDAGEGKWRALKRFECRIYKARGFTLIEVLLATVLLAAGLALAFATLGAATKSAQRGELLAQRNERMRAVAGFLRTRIGSARPIAFALDPDSGTSLHFVGAADRIRFVADLPDYLGRGGPYLHDVSVVGDDHQTQLLVSFSLVQNGVSLPEQPPRPPEPLADGLSQVSFRYRGIGADGVLGAWQDQWTQAERLPLQVSVRIQGSSGGAWPELIIALPLAGGSTQGGSVPLSR